MPEGLINVNGENVQALEILFLTTMITLLPSLVVMMTSFTRFIISFSFLRTAMGTQQTPPNMVLVGLALFLTLFIMSPVITEVNETAVKPYSNGELTREQTLDAGLKPIRKFMLKQVRRKDLKLFMEIAETDSEKIETEDDIPITTIIPAFVISELRTAFIIGFMIYLPFIVIDMVIASTLMSMGMMMLPPTTISMPFKILLFVLADGWNLIVGELVKTFY